MNYRFESIKNLFNNFDVIKLLNGDYVAVKKNTTIIEEERGLVDAVKFAYTWVDALRYMKVAEEAEITKDDYSFAFDNIAEDIYNYIMSVVSSNMLETKDLLSKEELREIINQNSNLTPNAYLVVEGLYANREYIKAFDNWVRKTNNIPKKSDKLSR